MSYFMAVVNLHFRKFIFQSLHLCPAGHISIFKEFVGASEFSLLFIAFSKQNVS